MHTESGSLLEKKVLEMFSQQGWDCNFEQKMIEMPGRMFVPDITLMKDGQIHGFVECISGNVTHKKREQVLHIISEYKPKLFILTDGISYEVYINSKFIGTMSTPLSYEAYSRQARLLMYYDKIKGK